MRLYSYIVGILLLGVCIWTLGFGCRIIYPTSFWLARYYRQMEATLKKGNFQGDQEKLNKELNSMKMSIETIQDQDKISNVSSSIIAIIMVASIGYVVMAEKAIREKRV